MFYKFFDEYFIFIIFFLGSMLLLILYGVLLVYRKKGRLSSEYIQAIEKQRKKLVLDFPFLSTVGIILSWLSFVLENQIIFISIFPIWLLYEVSVYIYRKRKKKR